MGVRKDIGLLQGVSREKAFPGSVSWGVMGSVGGSWASPSDWKCPKCGRGDRLVVWGAGREVLSSQCFECWRSGEDKVEQLTLF